MQKYFPKTVLFKLSFPLTSDDTFLINKYLNIKFNYSINIQYQTHCHGNQFGEPNIKLRLHSNEEAFIGDGENHTPERQNTFHKGANNFLLWLEQKYCSHNFSIIRKRCKIWHFLSLFEYFLCVTAIFVKIGPNALICLPSSSIY